MEYNEKVIEEAIDKILSIAEERNEYFKELKRALSADDQTLIKEYSLKLLGLEDGLKYD